MSCLMPVHDEEEGAKRAQVTPANGRGENRGSEEAGWQV